jgi:hypothetical protein
VILMLTRGVWGPGSPKLDTGLEGAGACMEAVALLSHSHRFCLFCDLTASLARARFPRAFESCMIAVV